MTTPTPAAPNSNNSNDSKVTPPPTRTRAIVCLLLNIIVFPGLGTLTSGDRTRKRTGILQLGLGILLIPLLVLTSVGGVLLGGASVDTVKAWVTNFMLLLVLWTVVTSIQIFREAWRRAKTQRN